MTIGIYCIRHERTGKRYIGKSVNIEHRLQQHKHKLTRTVYDRKTTNRHLWNAVQRYGWGEFETWVVECFDAVDEELIAERELYYMDFLRTCERRFGYNLRRDSQSRMIVHDETKAIMSALNKGDRNPNFGNHWSEKQRDHMRQNRIGRAERYGDEWRLKVSEASRQYWENNPEKRAQMGSKISQIKRKYDFLQLDRGGRLIRIWDSVEQIEEELGFKRQPIYSVCHGWKLTYRDFAWRQVPKSANFRQLILAAA